jgi:PadR family transcriptional regulator, regulatory protein PadR
MPPEPNVCSGIADADHWHKVVKPGTLQYMVVPGLGKQLSQMRRGAIEFCVLSLLRDEDRYGFDISRTLSSFDGLVTSEGTIYPLLGRLRQEGYVETTWHESPQGPPRRYYRLTDAGRGALDAFVVEWDRFRDSVDKLLEGERSS